MTSATYVARRAELRTYFDRTAVEAWARLTSTAPVGRIRATVRAGRDAMREVLLGWLPDDLRDCRLLDAGCGTGALSLAAARRGAAVHGVEIAPRLVEIARERAAAEPAIRPQPTFLAGDMLDPKLGAFDYVVAMDSVIHYSEADVVDMLAKLAERTHRAVLFTFAPHTRTLGALHAIGRCFPRGNRAPAIVPLREQSLRARVAVDARLTAWRLGRSQRIATGFYCSQALELVRR